MQEKSWEIKEIPTWVSQKEASALIVKALKDALKEKVTEMTKREVKELLDKLGVKVEEVTDEIVAKVQAQKALLDAETRRKTRLFWGPVGFIAGVLASWLYSVLF